jgi:hypothetical protein
VWLKRAGNKLIYRQREEDDGVGEYEDGKNDEEERDAEESCAPFEGVPHDMENDEEGCRNVAEKENGIEQAENRSHRVCFCCRFFFYSTPICPDGHRAA